MKEARKFDENKSRIDLIPPKALMEIGDVFNYGAKKYGAYNWANNKGLEWHRLYAATQRHLNSFWNGENIDESGYSHLSHAACSILMLMDLYYHNHGIDDRYTYKEDDYEIPCNKGITDNICEKGWIRLLNNESQPILKRYLESIKYVYKLIDYKITKISFHENGVAHTYNIEKDNQVCYNNKSFMIDYNGWLIEGSINFEEYSFSNNPPKYHNVIKDNGNIQLYIEYYFEPIHKGKDMWIREDLKVNESHKFYKGFIIKQCDVISFNALRYHKKADLNHTEVLEVNKDYLKVTKDSAQNIDYTTQIYPMSEISDIEIDINVYKNVPKICIGKPHYNNSGNIIVESVTVEYLLSAKGC